MAIIKCAKCGGNVSDKAKACPHCGTNINFGNEDISSVKKTLSDLEKAPVKKKRKSKVFLWCAAILVFSFSLFLYLGNLSDWSSVYWEDLFGAIKGDPEAQYYLGKHYADDEDFKTAVKWFQKAADQGNADAQINLGFCYQEGQGVPQNYDKAVKWYQKAADQGNAGAQNNLGFCYQEGQGVPQDYDEAVKWYLKAADQGFAFAQNNLGFCYQEGQGVPKNYNEAVKWYLKATEGYTRGRAELHLGDCYEHGYGVVQDITEAIKWYKKAADDDDSEAREALKRLGY